MEHTESIPPFDAPDPGGAGSPIPFRARHRSHADEIDELMGGDRSFVEKVRANFYEQEAGRHVVRVLSALAALGDFTPNQALRYLIWEHSWLSRGYSLRNGASSECDCRDPWGLVIEGHCTGCGATDARGPRVNSWPGNAS